MRYEHMIQGTFISRPNRFIAHVAIRRETGGEEETVVCHVKNTGRCRELLLPGAAVILQFHPEAAALGRKTEYSLIGVLKERNGELLLINMDSQAPNQVAAEWLHAMEQAPTLPVNGYDSEKFQPALRLANIRREVTHGQSRFDLAFDMVFASSSASAFQSRTKPAFMEVKGVTLEENGVAMFPDAPTERGIKHILELAEAVKAGYEAYVLFVIQMKGIREFTPNQKTHPQFGDALCLAHEAGVHILAYDCIVTADTLEIDRAIPVFLSTY
ncbi:DNA/RNA nuclease SfsA [Hungatella sp. SB206]|uniref:DNA/RNA nuclease SfsA n=1 Tax=Hungatella sp. SB206 TaxID=2937758 RepID=UPI003DA81C76